MKKSHSIIFISLILALCLLPLISMLLGYEAENRENRPLARAPRLFNRNGLNLSFPSDFDDWFSDHFGLREEMVTAFNGMTMGLFADTLNEKVVVGKSGFLFFEETMEDYLGSAPMTEEEIAMAAASLRLQKEYCESLGIGFAFALAPNKNTIYPEFMPDYCERSQGPGNRERLYAALAKEGVETIDLAALLIAGKAGGQLYYSTDTHWNDRGAIIAYRALMEKAAEGFEWNAYESAAGEEKIGRDGDLNNFVLPALGGRETYIDYGVEKEYALDEGADPARDASFGTVSGANGANILMFRDSFTEALIPYISNNAGRAVYSAEFPYNYSLLEEGTTAVLIELVERNIKNLISGAPLMPALETEAPAISGEMEATIASRALNGYTQLFGEYGAAFAGHVYVEVKNEEGSHCFEAFPLESGFALTLPEGFSGEYEARVIAEGASDWMSLSL